MSVCACLNVNALHIHALGDHSDDSIRFFFCVFEIYVYVSNHDEGKLSHR